MYEVKKYSDEIVLENAETQKRFSMIEKLSRNFTVENKIALEMDKLLSIDLRNSRTSKSNNTITKPVQNIKPKVKTENVEDAFSELFEALKSVAPANIPVQTEQLTKAIENAINNTTIGFHNLNDEVKKRINNQVQIISYELPNITIPDFAKPNIESFQPMVDDLLLGHNIYLVGGAGTGKTFLGENILSKQALGRQHITINCSQWTSPTEIIGGQTMDGYQEGKLIEAWKNGYVLILDELPKIDPNTAGLFNDALSKTGISNAVIFNARRESFTKHPDFACIANGNIYPDKESIAYGANNKQDLSLLDRFAGSVYFIEKNPELERAILQNDMIWSICDKLRSIIEELKYEAQVSLRIMQNSSHAFMLEMQRLKSKTKNGINANEGKTFKVTIDSFISTFSDVQQKNLKDKLRYNEIFIGNTYRDFDTTKLIF